MAEFYLLDLERTIGMNQPYFWKWNRHGYTPHIEHAGIFPEKKAVEICKSDRDNRTVMISTQQIFKILGKDMKSHEGTTFY